MGNVIHHSCVVPCSTEKGMLIFADTGHFCFSSLRSGMIRCRFPYVCYVYFFSLWVITKIWMTTFFCYCQATGSKVGQVLEGFATITCALVISFVFGWKLALVVLSFLPLMIISGIIQGKVMAGAALKEKSQLQQASRVSNLQHSLSKGKKKI